MNHLDQLESAGDALVARQGFQHHDLAGEESVLRLVPFPVIHVDTGRKFPEIYAFRDRYAKEWGLNLIVRPCPPVEEVDPSLPPAARSAARKTLGVKNALAEFGLQGLIAGLRVHPLLHRTEIDIWRYTQRENIPCVDLYFAKEGRRYRSLGDRDITFPIASNASTVEEILEELEGTKVPERAGRAMDHESENAFERLRADGYM